MSTTRKTKPPQRPRPVHRSTGRRLSHEQQQEYVSLDQCCARLSSHGWIPNPLKRDHGEDVLVQIFESGNSTGLAFLLQAKSTANISSLTLKQSPNFLSYPFEVADLLHWIASAPPVVAIVWDVKRQEGRWILVSDAVRDLDARAVGWRKRKAVAVHIPGENSTDDSGLARLRHSVADHYLPVLHKQNQEFAFTPTFSFPDTEEGKSALAALQALFDTGAPVTIDGKFIKNVQMSEWWERAYGRPDEMLSISLGPATAKTSLVCRLEIDNDRFPFPVAVPYVELKMVRGGRKEVLLSNEHQKIPIHVRMTVRRPEGKGPAKCNFSFTIDHTPANIYDARGAAEFALGMHTARRVRLIARSSDKTIVDGPFPALKETAQSRDFLELWYDLLDKLCYIQPKIARFGAVRLAKRWLRVKDEIAIRRLHQILTSGEERAVATFGFSVSTAAMSRDQIIDMIAACKRDPSSSENRAVITLPAEESLRVVSVTVPLGRVEITVLNSLPMLEQLAEAVAGRRKSVKMTCKDVPVVRRYLDWLPGGQYAQVPP